MYAKPKVERWKDTALYYVYFKNESIGAGWRYAWAKIGYKWVYIKGAACGTVVKFHKPTWDNMKPVFIR